MRHKNACPNDYGKASGILLFDLTTKIATISSAKDSKKAEYLQHLYFLLFCFTEKSQREAEHWRSAAEEAANEKTRQLKNGNGSQKLGARGGMEH